VKWFGLIAAALLSACGGEPRRNGTTPLSGAWIGEVTFETRLDIDGSGNTATFRDWWVVEQRPDGATRYCLWLCYLGFGNEVVYFDNLEDPLRYPAMVPNQFQRVAYSGWADATALEIHLDVNDINIGPDGKEIELPGFTVDTRVTVEKHWDYNRSMHDY
jgi:hypothetical protein